MNISFVNTTGASLDRNHTLCFHSHMNLLIDNAVHIWHLALESPRTPGEDCFDVLSQDEKDRADRFASANDRRRFVCGRGTLRVLLGAYLDRDPLSIQFHYNDYGKPGIDDVSFNVSHSGGMVLYAFTGEVPVGVDIERIRPNLNIDRIADRFFEAGETEDLAKVTEDLRTEAFYSCWTRKEAFSKAHGAGLFMGLSKFRVSLTPGEPARLISVGDIRSDGDNNTWSISDIEIGPGFKAALAVGTAAPDISFYSL